MEYSKKSHDEIFKCGVVEHVKDFAKKYAENKNKTILELGIEDSSIIELLIICDKVDNNLKDLKLLMESKGLLPD